MILLGKTTIGKKTFMENDSEGTVYPKTLGFEDNWYGGYIKEFRKTKYGIYMLLNRKGDIVNLGYFEHSLTDEGKKLLGIGGVENGEETEQENETNDGNEKETLLEDMDRNELIQVARDKGIKGNLVTLSKEKLIEKIKGE